MFSKSDDKSKGGGSTAFGDVPRGAASSAVPSLISADLKVVGNLESAAALVPPLAFSESSRRIWPSIDAPASVSYEVVYATSDNRWNIFSIEKAKKVLGYAPEDAAGSEFTPGPSPNPRRARAPSCCSTIRTSGCVRTSRHSSPRCRA